MPLVADQKVLRPRGEPKPQGGVPKEKGLDHIRLGFPLKRIKEGGEGDCRLKPGETEPDAGERYRQMHKSA